MIGQGYIVFDDLYDISRRIKEIDEDYFIFYSYKRKKYEVHHSKQRGSSLAVTIPFAELDARTLDYVRKTKSENVQKFIAETEVHNKSLDKKILSAARANAELQVEYALKKASNRKEQIKV